MKVIDIQARTIRTITTKLSGSSLFPSWTKDGRLCFRYDGKDFRGFMIADHVLDAPEQRLSGAAAPMPLNPRWSDIFPETPSPTHGVAVVMIWAPWSAHSPQALIDLQRASDYFRANNEDATVATAVEIGSMRSDVDRMRLANRILLPEVPLTPARFMDTEAVNQIPTLLLFRNGRMIDRRLGAQRFADLTTWVQGALGIRNDEVTVGKFHTKRYRFASTAMVMRANALRDTAKTGPVKSASGPQQDR